MLCLCWPNPVWKRKKSHATSVAVILPICVFSSILYLTDGRVTLGDAAPYLLWGALGSIIGSWLLTKIKGCGSTAFLEC